MKNTCVNKHDDFYKICIIICYNKAFYYKNSCIYKKHHQKPHSRNIYFKGRALERQVGLEVLLPGAGRTAYGLAVQADF